MALDALLLFGSITLIALFPWLPVSQLQAASVTNFFPT
jgi:hypothetical protein